MLPADRNDRRFVIYAAGLFDGEGCVTIERNRKNYVFRAKVTMTFQPAVRRLHAAFGGRLSLEVSKRPEWTDKLSWVVEGAAAEAFLRQVRPYLDVKAAEVDVFLTTADALALCGREPGPGHPWSDIERAVARSASLRLQAMKGNASHALKLRRRRERLAAASPAPLVA